MNHALETIVGWGAVSAGVIACLFAGRLLLQEVRRGVRGRFAAAVVYAVLSPVLGALPLVIALGARWLGEAGGVALFSANGGNDGNLSGVGLTGFAVAFGAAVLFAALMLVQAWFGAGGSHGADEE